MQSKETILQLYEQFMDDIYYRTSKQSKIGEKIIAVAGPFEDSLTEKQKQEFDKVMSLESEKAEAVNKQIFIFSYGLATKLLIEGLATEDK